MNVLQQGILILIRSALTEECLPLPTEFDLAQAAELAKKHQIEVLLYEGAVRCGIEKNAPQMLKLFEQYCKNLLVSERQMSAIEKICRAFDEAKVDYMPLKGCRMKKMYPKAEMRSMSDADILIRTEQYEQIRPIALKLGYEESVESDHELIWNTPSLQLELHKRLIPSYNRDYYRYFGNGWHLATEKSGSCYSMPAEDEYIYLFTHFAKHYRDGGIGIRHVTDLWVYRRTFPQMNESYIVAKLDELQLREFYQNVCRLIGVWFEEEVADEKTEFMTDFVFDSGSWGTHESHILAEGVRRGKTAGTISKGRRDKFSRILFLPLEHMREKFPVLKKAPVLLPVFWVVRGVRVLLFRREQIAKQHAEWQTGTVERIEVYQQSLNYVGLDFRFEER